MQKIQNSLKVFLTITILLGVFVHAAPTGADVTFKIEGYITDSSGTPLADAYLIFNNLTVPSAKTDQQGYYSTYAPAGTYHLNVWPPYNSNYINYDEQDYIVSTAATKNITLSNGCKVYGYVQNAAGSPMIGASVLFKAEGKVLCSGYFTNNYGYYYAVVPVGTYTIDAHPQTAYDPSYPGQCTYFPTYTETGYTVTADVYRNITVDGVAPPGKVLTSGYIVDENGIGIPGANIIFNQPQTVPSVKSDSNGYYQIVSPAGTYHVNVWPPADSHYINYDEPAYAISFNTIKNITLPTGFKVSGYLKDLQGNPVSGGIVQVGNYLSGHFSTQTGYYFVAVPAGTYTLNAHTGVSSSQEPLASFQPYIENDFAVHTDITKNITLQTTLVPSPTPTPAPTTKPTTSPTTAPTPTPQPSDSYLTIQTQAQNYQVGSTLTITGTLISQNNDLITDKTVTISYAVDNTAQWIPIGAAQTDNQGQYTLQWLIPASGTFTLKAQWEGTQTIQAAQSTTTVSFIAATGKQVFFVQSNSTITNLSFNSTAHILTFAASGPEGSTGQTEVTVSKNIVEEATAFAVVLDGKPLQFGITDMDDNWVLTFSYHHSSHIVTVDLAATEKGASVDSIDNNSNILMSAVPFIVVACLAAGLLFYKSQRKP